jgi:hypothetical protein
VEPWGGFEVALGWLWGAYQLAINTLWGGFDVALKSHRGGLAGHSAFLVLSLKTKMDPADDRERAGRRVKRGAQFPLHDMTVRCV